MFGKDKIRQIVGENLSLLCIFVGFVLVAFSIGPYQNGDTAWELDAVSGIVRYGLPYTNGFYLMDQPPLGFYIQAFFSKIFGLSINNGTFLVTLFGLGCVALVYAIGKVVYNKTTGFLQHCSFPLALGTSSCLELSSSMYRVYSLVYFLCL